jgi:hypothetical protein
MTYQEMVEHLAALDEAPRRTAIQRHWQSVLSDGFIAFVQGQIENYRKMALGSGEMEAFYANVDDDIERLLRQQAFKGIARVMAVWDSMVAVYEALQQHSERQGDSGGMVDHGAHTTMPRGVGVQEAARCFRCGSPAASQGLCNGCLDTQQAWEQDDLDYDRQRYDQQRDLLDHQRLQDDQLFYDQQQDFNSSYDYTPSYDHDSDY